MVLPPPSDHFGLSPVTQVGLKLLYLMCRDAKVFQVLTLVMVMVMVMVMVVVVMVVVVMVVVIMMVVLVVSIVPPPSSPVLTPLPHHA